MCATGLLLFFRAAALTSRHLLSSKKKRRQFAIVEIAGGQVTALKEA
jgi:hypothetical protein